jgi:5-formyltetrahydrofolate cyclo-ligase
MKAMADAPVQRMQKANYDNFPQSPADPSADKKSLRRQVALSRDSIPTEIRIKKDLAIEERLTGLKAFKESLATLFYAAFRSEVATEKLIRLSLSGRRVTVLPRVDNAYGILKLYKIADWSDLVPGSWGILEPLEAKETEIGIDDIDIVLAPGVAFDSNCNRLGYGKGFYDKLLSRKKGLNPLVIGLAYEEQIVNTLPCNPHDIKMDIIITDKRIITCHEPKKD